MLLSELPYPQRLVVELLHHLTFNCKKTENMRASEVIEAMSVFFTKEQLDEAVGILTGVGKQPDVKSNTRCLACGGDHGNSGLPCPKYLAYSLLSPSSVQ